MRRGAPVNIARGGGGGGYNKPPPGPLLHSPGGRMRLHTHDANGATIKDRFGSPRERSPNLGSSLPLSPSHLNAREKSPNPSSQDLHDCSMCLSAYIQSLNTVCGTACRLAQCLAQVGAESGCNEVGGAGTPLHQLLREAAEMWEGIARAVGVASTGVKNQILSLLQETQARHTMDYAESARKQEVAKIMRMMLSTFLTLHCQFSLVVVERFSGMLHHLKEENSGGTNPSTGNVNQPPGGLNGVYNNAANHDAVGTSHRPSPSPSVSPHHPSPSPPQLNHPPYSSLTPQQQQLLLQQQQQQQQQILLHLLHLNSGKTDVSSPLAEDGGSRSSSMGGSGPMQPPLLPLWSPNLGSPINSYSSQVACNSLSPGMCLLGDHCSDAISRRWSMGGASLEEGSHDKLSSLTPFSLIANRRWSVPETSEHDSHGGYWGGLGPLHGGEYGGGAAPSGRGATSRGFAKGNSQQFISRESSCTRSPSHSRSVTPDQSRRVSFVSNEELQDIIELLTIPLNASKEDKGIPYPPSKGPTSSGGKQLFHPPSLNSKMAEESGTPHHHRHSIPENEHESQEAPQPHPTSSDASAEKASKDDPNNSKMFQQSLWSENPPEERAPPSGLAKNIPEEVGKGETNQISTSLWPPTDSAPGVTLTECVGETEKQLIPPWSDERNCCEGPCSVSQGFNRDSINRASWPISAFSNLSIVDPMIPGSPSAGSQGGWTPRPNLTNFRRHSTDAPYLLSQGSHSPLMAKTRSFENLASKVNMNSTFAGSEMESTLPDLFLPALPPSLSSASSPTTAHYTLFTTSS